MPLDIESNIDMANVSVSFSRTIELVCALKYIASKQSVGIVDQTEGVQGIPDRQVISQRNL